MIIKQFYDLHAFADVIYATDEASFLKKLMQHLKRALLFYEDEKDSDKFYEDKKASDEFYEDKKVSGERRCFYFKLMLSMVPFSVNVPLLRKKQEDIRLYEEEICSWKNLFRLSFWRQYIFSNAGNAIWEERLNNMQISIDEMIVLASTVYYLNGWGGSEDLRTKLSLAAET